MNSRRTLTSCQTLLQQFELDSLFFFQNPDSRFNVFNINCSSWALQKIVVRLMTTNFLPLFPLAGLQSGFSCKSCPLPLSISISASGLAAAASPLSQTGPWYRQPSKTGYSRSWWRFCPTWSGGRLSRTFSECNFWSAACSPQIWAAGPHRRRRHSRRSQSPRNGNGSYFESLQLFSSSVAT